MTTMTEEMCLEGINRQAEAIVTADSAPAVFKALLGAVAMIAPRGAVFLIHQEGLKGWGSVGYSPDVEQRVRALSAPLAAAGLDSILGDGPGGLQFGQPAASETRCEVMRVGQRPIALLVAERGAEETPWLPGVLGLMARVAELRLALILMGKKMRSGPTVAAVPPRPSPAEPKVTRAAELDAAVPPRPSPAEPKGTRLGSSCRMTRSREAAHPR